MKKLFKTYMCLLLTVVIALSAVGCGSDTSGSNTENNAEYYNLTRVRIGDKEWTGDRLIPLGYKDAYMRYNSKSSGTFIHYSYPPVFTSDGEKFTVDGVVLKMEKSGTGKYFSGNSRKQQGTLMVT